MGTYLHVFGYVLTRILGQYIPKWPVYCEFAYAQHVLVCIEVVGIVYARIDTMFFPALPLMHHKLSLQQPHPRDLVLNLQDGQRERPWPTN